MFSPDISVNRNHNMDEIVSFLFCNIQEDFEKQKDFILNQCQKFINYYSSNAHIDEGAASSLLTPYYFAKSALSKVVYRESLNRLFALNERTKASENSIDLIDAFYDFMQKSTFAPDGLGSIFLVNMLMDGDFEQKGLKQFLFENRKLFFDKFSFKRRETPLLANNSGLSEGSPLMKILGAGERAIDKLGREASQESRYTLD